MLWYVVEGGWDITEYEVLWDWENVVKIGGGRARWGGGMKKHAFIVSREKNYICNFHYHFYNL